MVEKRMDSEFRMVCFKSLLCHLPVSTNYMKSRLAPWPWAEMKLFVPHHWSDSSLFTVLYAGVVLQADDYISCQRSLNPGI